MFPYFELPALRIGPFTIHAFGFLVGMAVLVGSAIVLRRAARLGLDVPATRGMLLWMLGWGFLISHLETLAFDEPALFLRPWSLLEEPMKWLNLWVGMSSFGGIVGGVFGGWWYFRRRGWSRTEQLTYLDLVAFAFPFAWSIARFGCYLAHDHPGIHTTSWLAVRYPDGPRFDLGLMDFFVAVTIAALFLRWGRQPRPGGFFLSVFMLLYGPARLLLDNLRTEGRFVGLTSGQLGALAAIAVGLWVFRRVRATARRPEASRTDASHPSAK